MRIPAVAVLAALLAGPRLAAADPNPATHEDLYARVAPCIVSIEARSKVDGRDMSWFGTGTIISEKGAVLTSTTVCPANATKVWIRFRGGKRIEAKFVAGSDKLEVALIQLPDGKYPHVVTGDSTRLKLGHVVYTFGNCQHSMEVDDQVAIAQGEVSGFYKITDVFEGKEWYEWCTYKGPVIETTAPLNPGVDGGPLIDAYGRIVGIMSLSYNETRWLGVAVPQSEWKEQVAKWERGEIDAPPVVKDPPEEKPPDEEIPGPGHEPGWLGATLGDPEPVVDAIARNSPAARGGLKVGDVILKINGKPVKSTEAFSKALKPRKPGDAVELTVRRGDKEESLKITLGFGPM